jgi:hypothetical protein
MLGSEDELVERNVLLVLDRLGPNLGLCVIEAPLQLLPKDPDEPEDVALPPGSGGRNLLLGPPDAAR